MLGRVTTKQQQRFWKHADAVIYLQRSESQLESEWFSLLQFFVCYQVNFTEPKFGFWRNKKEWILMLLNFCVGENMKMDGQENKAQVYIEEINPAFLFEAQMSKLKWTSLDILWEGTILCERQKDNKKRMTRSKLDGFSYNGDGCTSERPEWPV